MNQTELNKYKAMLEARMAELSAGLRNREDIAIEKTRMLWMKYSSPVSGNLPFGISIGNRICCGTSAAP